MDIFSSLVGLALLTLLAFFILRLFYVIGCNLIRGRRFHQNLAAEFERLRLSRMLAALGISKARYIHQTPVVEIRQHMQNCEQCENTQECDSRLAKGEVDADHIGFCNNEETLKNLRQS